MKRFRQFLQFSILSLLAAGTFSCRVFHQQDKITDFLEDGANRIKIVKTAYNVDVQIDKDGYVCIPSNDDVAIYFLIQNPKGLTLDYNLASLLDDKMIIMQNDYMNYLSDEEKEILNFEEDDVLYPNTKVEYTLGQQLLYRPAKRLRYDGTAVDSLGPGCTLDPKLGLNAESYSYKPVTGEFFTDEEYAEYRAAWLSACGYTEADVAADSEIKVPENFTMNVEPYTSNIRINTPPPYVQGACIMLDESTKTASSTGNYVICFNLPDTVFYADGIHRDVKKLYVTGLKASNARELEEGIELNIDFDAGTYTNDALSLETGSTDNLKKLYENNPYYNDGMPAVEFNAGEHPVYIWDDGHSFSKNPDYTYTVTLEDEAGLRSTVVLNSRYLQLDKPTARNSDKTYEEGVIYLSFPVDEDGNPTIKYFVLNLVAPDKTVGTAVKNITDVNVHYEIYSLNILRDQHNTGLIYTNIANYQEGSALDAKALRLTNGTLYDIRAYAYKDGYLGSELAHWYVTSGNYRYVDVEVESGIGNYGVEFGLDRYNLSKDADDNYLWTSETIDENGDLVSVPGEYNFMVMVEKDENGKKTYHYDDLTANMTVKIYNLPEYLATGEKNYYSDEETAEIVKSMKLVLRENSGIEMMSYIDNDELLSACSKLVTEDFSGDSSYLAANSEALTERQCTIPIKLPSVVAKNDEQGDIYYRLQLYAEIGTEKLPYSEEFQVPIRFVYTDGN